MSLSTIVTNVATRADLAMQNTNVPGAPSWLNVPAVVGLGGFLASILALWLGVSMLGRAGKGDIKGAAKQSGVAVIGLIWIAIAIGGAALTIATGTVGFFIKRGM